LTIRWRTGDDPFARFVNAEVATTQETASGPSITEASQIYLRAKG